jgi:hypothetical protein
MDISLYTDCAVMMAALGSGFYCLTLRREIKGLTANKKGLKLALSQMVEATTTAQTALREIRTQVHDEINRLDERMAEVSRARDEVEDMLDSADGQVAYQARRMQEARLVTEQALAPLLQQAEEHIQALSRHQVTDNEPPRPRRRSPVRARSLYEPEAEENLREDNPFLKAVHG